MIERGHRLPLKRQAELLGLSRGTLYYSPCAISAADLAIMRLRESIDAGGAELPVDERRLTRARRAVEKAIAVLSEGDDAD